MYSIFGTAQSYTIYNRPSRRLKGSASRILTTLYSLSRAAPTAFGKFVDMIRKYDHSASYRPASLVPLNLCDCFTGSFTEFVPFCRSLYSFSTFKDFSTFIPAW